MIYYLPSLYHRSVSEIDIPQGPDAQHFAWTSMAKVKKKKERERDTSQIHNTESGSCTLTIVTNCKSTILQSSIGKRLKHRKEMECLLSYLPPWLGMQSHSWRLSRLGSHSQTGVGLTQPGTVPFVEPFLKAHCLLHSGWDQSPTWYEGLQEFEGKIQLTSTFPGTGVPSSSLLPERAAS